VCDVLPAPEDDWAAFPPLQLLATQTGAFTWTGAFADTAGDAETEPAWTVPTDWLADGDPPPCELVLEVAPAPPDDWDALPPRQLLSAQTGAFTFTGAFTATEGPALAVPT
jgi:hypothetical protein